MLELLLSGALVLGPLGLVGPVQDPDPARPVTPAATEPGELLPPLRLPTLDGRTVVDLADLRGRVVLLIDFASW